MSILDTLFGGMTRQQMPEMAGGQQQQPMPDMAGQQQQGGGGLFGGILGNSGGGGGGGLRDTLRALGPAIAMLDPRNQQLGMFLMDRRQQQAEKSQQRENQQETISWLQQRGVGSQEASYLASDPVALRSFVTDFMAGANPKWEIKRLLNNEGQEQDFMVDMRDPSRMQPLGGAKAETEPYRMLSQEEAQGMGLSPGKSYQMGPDGRIGTVGDSLVNVNVGTDQMSPGQKKIDESFADEYIRWVGGGFADSTKQLDQLQESLGMLERGQPITGPGIGSMPDFVQPFINPDGVIAREQVEEVVQRNLREILGAQFTEREGERLISRAFNPRLSPQENAKRVRRLIGQVGDMASAKQAMVDYFNENGTLQGYRGPRPTLSQLDQIAFDDEDREGPTAGNKPLSEMTDEELEAIINGNR